MKPNKLPAHRCAFLTMQNPGDFVTDYDLAIAPLAERGWGVEEVVWTDSGIDWDRYDAVYICTPWDYIDKACEFLRVLETIDASRAVLVNPFELVKWNLQKTYLRDIEARGGRIVPSRFGESFNAQILDDAFAEFAVSRVVVKPVVGANAADTFVVSNPPSAQTINQLSACFQSRPFIVQPFIETIQSVGEYSLFLLGGEVSHAIRKVPASGDFRVQEEHGADIRSCEPTPELIAAAASILTRVQPQPAYARADFVDNGEGDLLLMELELIEPSLYLRTDADAPSRFADALLAYVTSNMTSS